MIEVLKGGISNSSQKIIKNDEARNRSISDQAFVCHGDQPIKHLFRKLMDVDSFHVIRGSHRSGKTTLLVNLMNLLVNGYDGCGDWEIITNVFFVKNDEDPTVGSPEKIHHIDYFDEILAAISDIQERGSSAAVLLDDIECFYSDEDNQISNNIRKLISNRRKLGIMVIVCGSGDTLLYDDNLSPSKLKYDCEWGKLDKNNYKEFRENDILNYDLPFVDASYVMCNSQRIDTYITSRPFGWTDLDSEGWVFDPYSEASFVRYRDRYDLDLFWNGFGNISSVQTSSYIKDFFRKDKPVVDHLCPSKEENNVVDMAVRMKSMGLTDESIEFITGTPKTTLRRWAEKKGYEWRVGFIESPYQFRRMHSMDDVDSCDCDG